MKNIHTSALARCVLTLVVVCGFVFSTGVTFTKFEYRSSLDGYRCVPDETILQADDTDPTACGKIFHLNNQCSSFYYQPDNRQCILCRVYFYSQLWTNLLEELPGSRHFSPVRKNLPTNCRAILENDPSAASGLYEIIAGDVVLKVNCDMTTDGGGWIVFQNRFDGSVDFYRNFSEYENGFGDINGEFWLGLRYIQTLADKYPSELKMILSSQASGYVVYEQYKEFKLINGTNYTLYIRDRTTNITDRGGFLANPISDPPFSTYDRDLDFESTQSCAVLHHGGWWFDNDPCFVVYLNGKYCERGHYCAKPYGLHHIAVSALSLQKSKMMIRPHI